MSTIKQEYHSPFNMAVLVAGLGFFIDAFDLFLFNVYRQPSLIELGLKDAELTACGEKLLSWQMAGMMLGGIITGIIADKKVDPLPFTALSPYTQSLILPMLL